jgi:hypothetical protein
MIVLNVHTPTEDKIDDIKDTFYRALEHIFDKFPKYHMKMLLGDFNAKVGKEGIFKPTTWNESLHEISNDNGGTVVNFATSKNLTEVGGWTILKWILREIGWDGMDWIEVAQDRDHWRALVNTVLKFRVP